MKLYAITDEVLTPKKTILTQVKSALNAGVSYIQYRDKTSKDEDLLLTCKRLKSMCEDFGATFVINDRVDLAIEIKAHGLHVGKDDVALKDVKSRFDGIIGVSCYDDMELAKEAIKSGANYVAFGAFYPSKIKPNAQKTSLLTLKKAKDLGMKVAVIGGINSQNISSFLPYKPDMICAISAIFSGDVEENVKSLRDKINQ